MGSITIPIDAATEEALNKVANATRQTRDEIAAQALQAFAADEAEIVSAIQRGRADVDAGRTVSHDEAMAQLRRTARGA